MRLGRDCPPVLGWLDLLGACHSPSSMAGTSSPLPGCRHLLGPVPWAGFRLELDDAQGDSAELQVTTDGGELDLVLQAASLGLFCGLCG